MLFAWLAAALLVLRPLPQLRRLVATRDGNGGVALESAVVFSVTYLPWALHGLVTDRSPVLVSNGAGLVLYATMAALLVRYGAIRQGLIRPALLVGAMLVGAAAGGLNGALIVTWIAPVAYGVPQVVHALRAPTVRALSPATLLLSILEVGLWAVHAYRHGDVLMLVYMLASLSVHAATLGIWGARRDRRRQLEAVTAP